MDKFTTSLKSLVGSHVANLTPQSYDAHSAGFWLETSNQVRLDSHYWRFICVEIECLLSSFSGNQFSQDPVKELRGLLMKRKVENVEIDSRIGDIQIHFEEGFELQLFHFCRSESWEIHFPDGSGRSANHYGDDILKSRIL